MKKVLLAVAALALIAMAPVQASASTAQAVVAGGTAAASTTYGVAAGVSTPGFFISTGLVAPVALTYVIASQKDQYDEPIWHRLACGLFGNEGRVGNETDSACNHIE